jgi:tetratricopeptide (TPR) repeat protein
MRDARWKRAWYLVLPLTAGVLIGHGPAAARDLTSAELDGYRIWLHALESTMAARETADADRPGRVYPRHIDGSQLPAVESLVDVAHALEDLESKPRLLQEPANPSALHALNRARNYSHLAEYDSAMAWYENAAVRDTEGDFRAELDFEIMVTAVALRSARKVQDLSRALLAQSDLEDRQQELELAFRFMLATSDTTHLSELVDNLAMRQQTLSGRTRFWQAFSLNWLGRWDESFAILRQLLLHDGYSHGLEEAQRAWVLTAIADQIYLLGDRQAARPLYRALASSAIGEASVWAACQLAAFDLLDGRFLKAGTALEGLCRMKENVIWKQHACRLAALSDELERLRDKGRSHGADVYYQP